jgi:hypothetical protein
MVRATSKRERHVRWNWEQSPDSPQMARYHFIIVGDKDREGTMRMILQQIGQIRPVERMRHEEGRARKMKYLFETYDSETAPKMLDFSRLSLPVIQDKNLRERVRGSIDVYVANLYK